MNLTNCIAQGIDINELFPIVVEEVTKLLQCDRATMFLLTDDEKSSPSTPLPRCFAAAAAAAQLASSVLFAVFQGTGPLIKIQVPVTGESIAGSCVSTKTTINLKDAYTGETCRCVACQGRRRGGGPRSVQQEDRPDDRLPDSLSLGDPAARQPHAGAVKLIFKDVCLPPSLVNDYARGCDRTRVHHFLRKRTGRGECTASTASKLEHLIVGSAERD
eukprot:4113901-Pleurochrysis_carterae.AAC.7